MTTEIRPEDWQVHTGSRLRGWLGLLPAIVFAFAYLGFLCLAALMPAPWLARCQRNLIRGWGRPILALLGIRLEVHGAEHLDAPGPAIVLFNHQSILDIVVLAATWPDRGVVLYKREFHRIPLLGRTLRSLKMVAVDRSNREAALASMTQAAQHIRESDARMLIAPEGTRSRDGTLGPFKRGPFHLAMQTGAPLVPMIMRGVRELMGRSSLVGRAGTVRVDFLDPIPPGDGSLDELSTRMRETRELFLRYVSDSPANGDATD